MQQLAFPDPVAPRIATPVTAGATIWRTTTLIADLVDALSVLASTSESKDWQSLPRPDVECIQVQGVRAAKESDLISKSLVVVDQGEAAFLLTHERVPPHKLKHRRVRAALALAVP
jgi:hypothetical protein